MLNRAGEMASGSASARAVLDTQDDEARRAMLRRMGAINLDEPLPHAKFIKVLRTGRILPWNELLAEQPSSEVACCDEHGNTDPSAWQEDVVSDIEAPDEATMAIQAQIAMLSASTGFAQGPAITAVPTNPPAFPEGVTTYQDADQLIAKLL